MSRRYPINIMIVRISFPLLLKLRLCFAVTSNKISLTHAVLCFLHRCVVEKNRFSQNAFVYEVKSKIDIRKYYQPHFMD